VLFDAVTTQRLHPHSLSQPRPLPCTPSTASPVGHPIDWLDFEASKGVRQRRCLRRPSLSPLSAPHCYLPTVVCRAQLASTSRAPRSAVECLSLSLNLRMELSVMGYRSRRGGDVRGLPYACLDHTVGTASASAPHDLSTSACTCSLPSGSGLL